MTKIILAIVTFLLTIFPSSGTLLGTYQQLTFPGRDVIVEDIMKAVETKDVEMIESMLSESKKQKTENLSEKIDVLLNSVDGEIIKTSLLGAGDGSDYSNYGVKKSNRTWRIEFETTEDVYVLYVYWIIIDNQEPENVGLIGLSLFDSVGYNETLTATCKL